ncbi:MAG: hypothetical protein ATN35_01835 [Epulopiscium sp. Nele67-Bin004]|nr:MAG: hypothetical protein ATN35_01835 [Epulopiscium sp. Nele67-Bin004]
MKDKKQELLSLQNSLYKDYSVSKIPQIKHLISSTFRKMDNLLSNLDFINPFTAKKEIINAGFDAVNPDNPKSQEKFIKTAYGILPQKEHGFYKKKYKSITDAIEIKGVNISLRNYAIEHIDREEANWYIDEIQKIRDELYEQLKKRLEELSKIQQYLSSISDTGIFWDLCKTDILKTDLNMLMKWSNILSNNENLQKLIELIGRSIRQNTVKRLEEITIEKKIPIIVDSLTSKEEIKTIELGNDLMRVIPQEMLWLSDTDMELLFYKKYTEKTLLCYHLEGQDVEYVTETEQSYKEVEEIDKKGPIIVCVDTSGSMAGAPEIVAKAVALCLGGRAIAEDRACYVINFSTSIQTYVLDKDMGMDKLIAFLQMSFHGGTDVSPALNHALGILEDETFEKSDVLIVSDFVMGNLDEAIVEKINTQKELKTKFYGLNIGNTECKPDYLDKQWNYSTFDGDIIELSNEIAQTD